MNRFGMMMINLAMAATVTVCAMAQETAGYPVGYCNGEINTTSLVKHPNAGDWVSSAIYINPEYAASLGGNQIRSIRAGLCSAIHLESLKVWVREDLDGENLVEGIAESGDIRKGWNMVDLQTPYDIPDTEGRGFYIGFSMLQDGRSAGPAVLRQPGDGSFFLQLGAGEWVDHSDEGILCVEGLAFGDNLPKTNAELVSVTTAPKFIMSEGTLEAVATVRNHGTLTITGFDVIAVIDGAEEPCPASATCDIPFGEERDVRFVISPRLSSPAPATRTATFTITMLREGADENMTDNSATTTFDVIETGFRRMVMVEEFTTERCPNCPPVAENLHKVLADPRYADNVTAICHHAGFNIDWLTIPSDIEYEWFYNANGDTYAPAMMMDRAAFNGETSALYLPRSQTEIEQRINARMAEPTPVSVNVSVVEYADKTATVKVSGERVSETPDDLRVTVYIVENNVPARSQAGSGEGYMHQHVNRAVNSTWGEPLVWNGDTYEYECTLELKDIWDRRNMEAIAIVGRYTPENALTCNIENAGRVSFDASGINGIIDEAHRVAAYYDAQGRRLAERPSDGFYITVYSDGTTKKSF